MEPARVIVVTTSGCHFCEDAKAKLDNLATHYPLQVRVVGASTPEGWALVSRHSPAFMPLVLLDGEFFSVGLFPHKKLRRKLDAREATSA